MSSFDATLSQTETYLMAKILKEKKFRTENNEAGNHCILFTHYLYI